MIVERVLQLSFYRKFILKLVTDNPLSKFRVRSIRQT